MTGVSKCSQQRGNLKDNGYKEIGLRDEANFDTCFMIIKFLLIYVYPIDFKVHCDGKGENPREQYLPCFLLLLI
ncbi:hypothetical protein AM629_02540 [Photorhabdus heterorhabditis]|uniref:Uncharacterized protein n=1 Tax=Photorhabdus heterorhabditis TaxID=880156 RepID=A0ABR5KFR4_9GAMM|nr:hypothetical protein AM629_02540 [Photorhabdus heterorhabditis]